MFAASKGPVIQGNRYNKRNEMWGDEKVPEMDSGGVFMTAWI